jgi:exonuclease SbcC
MKPLRLVTSALGPYAGKQILDFRELRERTLFLIHGPTGSGKTTILDAICYAFYGECSGGERDVKQMRSDHADPTLLTEVTLDFRLGAEDYRIHRRPEQQRPKKRGEGTTTARPKATLTKRTGISDDSNDGTVIASQWSKVTDAVEDLLGFRSDQFRQVVMLPQGQFRKLLMADSRERQAILEVLFQTELYRRIEEALKKASKAIETDINTERLHMQFLLNQAASESVEDLVQQHAEAGKKLLELQQSLAHLKSLEKKAQERLNEGKQIAEKFAELHRAKKELSSREERIDTIAAMRVVLNRARRAAPIAAEEKALEKRIKEAGDARKRLDEARISVKQAGEARESATEALNREDERKEERDEARHNLGRLEDLTERVKELDDAKKKLAQATTQLLDKTNQFNLATEDLEQSKGKIEQNSKLRDETEKIASNEELLRMQAEEAEKASGQLKQLLTLSSDELVIKKEIQECDDRFSKVEQQLLRGSRELTSLETAWIEGQAAILARELKTGDPCPVCGSEGPPHSCAK